MVSIYGIYSGEECLYLGSTSRSVEVRAKEHIKELSKGIHKNKSLQKAYNNVTGKIEIKMINSIETDNTLLRYFYESLYNSLLKPKCNKCIIQQGQNKINLQRTSKETAEKLINFIDRLE